MYTTEKVLSELRQHWMDEADSYLTLKAIQKVQPQMLDSIKSKYSDNQFVLDLIKKIEYNSCRGDSLFSDAHTSCYRALVESAKLGGEIKWHRLDLKIWKKV